MLSRTVVTATPANAAAAADADANARHIILITHATANMICWQRWTCQHVYIGKYHTSYRDVDQTFYTNFFIFKVLYVTMHFLVSYSLFESGFTDVSHVHSRRNSGNLHARMGCNLLTIESKSSYHHYTMI
jgi:hypothetical protein